MSTMTSCDVIVGACSSPRAPGHRLEEFEPIGALRAPPDEPDVLPRHGGGGNGTVWVGITLERRPDEM